MSSFHTLLPVRKNGDKLFRDANNKLHVKYADDFEVVVDKNTVKYANEFEENFVVDDNTFPDVHVDDQDVSESKEEECQADHSIFEFLQENV